jgi:hypothetical protein
MKLSAILVLAQVLLTLQSPALAQCVETVLDSESQDIEAELEEMPNLGQSAKSFVPQNWTLEKVAYGDLNKDGVKDMAFTMGRYSKTETLVETDVARQVVVTLGAGENNFLRVANSGTVAELSGNCGMLGCYTGEHSDVSISGGNLVVTNMSGCRNGEIVTLRFRLNNAIARFELIGLDRLEFDRMAWDQTLDSKNLLNGDRLCEYRTMDLNSNKVKTLLSRRTKDFAPDRLPILEEVSLPGVSGLL